MQASYSELTVHISLGLKSEKGTELPNLILGEAVDHLEPLRQPKVLWIR